MGFAQLFSRGGVGRLIKPKEGSYGISLRCYLREYIYIYQFLTQTYFSGRFWVVGPRMKILSYSSY